MSRRATFADLAPRQCRWVLTEPRGAETIFCADPAQEGKPYCPHHCQQAYVAGSKLTAAMIERLVAGQDSKPHPRPGDDPYELT